MEFTRKQKALMRKVAQRLRRVRHEEHYNQKVLVNKTSCGTAACIAGYVGMELGAKPLFEPRRNVCDVFKLGKEEIDNGRLMEEAGMALGLDSWQSDALFSAFPAENWPDEYAKRWRAARPKSKDTSKQPSRIAADLLDALADGKVEL